MFYFYLFFRKLTANYYFYFFKKKLSNFVGVDKELDPDPVPGTWLGYRAKIRSSCLIPIHDSDYFLFQNRTTCLIQEPSSILCLERGSVHGPNSFTMLDLNYPTENKTKNLKLKKNKNAKTICN